MNHYLVVIAGPTASGKTATAIQVAKHFNTEILSADSRQFFQEMSIGTAKPTAEELAAVPHHFVNNISIKEDYSAGRFELEVLTKLDELFQQHELVVLTGGSGLYIQAVLEGFDELPKVDPAIRARLIDTFEQDGIEPLQQQLKELDPSYYQTVDLQNQQRVIRALEICIGTGKPFSSYHNSEPKQRNFEVIQIALDWDRDALYERINKRVDLMLAAGLLDEAKALHPQRGLNALETVGYTELFDYFEGKTDLDTAVELIKRNTRRYAKRQLTWLRRDDSVAWFKPDDVAGMIEYIKKALR